MLEAEEKAIALLYRLTLEDAEQQALQNFPVLKMIRNDAVAKFLWAAEGISLEQKIRLSVALVKEQHLELFQGLALSDVVESQYEVSESTLYDNYRRLNPHGSGIDVSCQRGVAGNSSHISRKRLARAASAAISSAINSEFTREDAFFWVAVNHCGSWVIETWMDSNQQGFDVEYHILHVTDYPAVPTQDLQRQRLRHCLTYKYPRRLGVAALSWELHSDDEVEESAALAAEVCLHAMNLVRSALRQAN